VPDFFKRAGCGWQGRVNAVLRSSMERQQGQRIEGMGRRCTRSDPEGQYRVMITFAMLIKTSMPRRAPVLPQYSRSWLR
jgi:hypothetical protein